MQVYDIIKIFDLQLLDQGGQIVLKYMDPVDIRIGPEQREIDFLGNIMDLSSIYLFLQASDYGSSEYNIPDRTKSYDKILDQMVYWLRLFINSRSASQYSSFEGLSSQRALAP